MLGNTALAGRVYPLHLFLMPEKRGHLGRTGPGTVRVTYQTERVIRYIHGDKTQAFVTCGKYGCITHWESLEHIEPRQMKLNFATADFKLPAGIPVRLFDGADS